MHRGPLEWNGVAILARGQSPIVTRVAVPATKTIVKPVMSTRQAPASSLRTAPESRVMLRRGPILEPRDAGSTSKRLQHRRSTRPRAPGSARALALDRQFDANA